MVKLLKVLSVWWIQIFFEEWQSNEFYRYIQDFDDINFFIEIHFNLFINASNFIHADISVSHGEQHNNRLRYLNAKKKIYRKDICGRRQLLLWFRVRGTDGNQLKICPTQHEEICIRDQVQNEEQ